MLTLKDAVGILQALLTPVIACVVAYIAWQQYRTAEKKLRLDLFDRRYQLYLAVSHLFDIVLHKPDLTVEEIVIAHAATNQRKFLVRDEIARLIDTVKQTAIERLLARQQAQNPNVEPNVLAQLQWKLQEFERWLALQPAVADEEFRKHLGFSENV